MSSSQETAVQIAKGIGDAAAVGVTIGTILQWLPALAAIFTVVWTGIRIYETRTLQKLIDRRKGGS